ncbi:hypothetical protein [Microbispora sp. H10949]|uniref:hypothetical protein n=1 Tax=Microbispora sp. H10949 TaxID=2729111 RepID=UPI00160112D2|nr:hypothetical protein [Microbispora sp. H10949]
MRIRIRRPLSSLATVLGLLVTTQLVSAAPAVANPDADGWCTQYEVCVYRLANYIDEQADYYNGDYDFTDDNFWFWGGNTYYKAAEIVDNRTSSVRNFDPGCTATLWQYVGWGGGHINVYPNGAIPNLVNLGFDNKASSLTWSCG